ncbi:MAG TPA: SRPBCC family protein [Hyphomonadaceae bacterium]|nr:SRPBCC family protein [Hyphomonadaceae bacterium]
MTRKIEKAQVSLPSDTEVRVTRDFAAPRALVWQAHTDPKLIPRWMGYPGWSMPVCEMDVRKGGKYRWQWRQDANGQGFGFSGTFSEVEAHAKLSYNQTYIPDGFDSAMPENNATLIRSTYSEKSGVTTLVTLMDFGSKEARDAAISTGMTDGMEVSYERLDVMLAEAQS